MNLLIICSGSLQGTGRALLAHHPQGCVGLGQTLSNQSGAWYVVVKAPLLFFRTVLFQHGLEAGVVAEGDYSGKFMRRTRS